MFNQTWHESGINFMTEQNVALDVTYARRVTMLIRDHPVSDFHLNANRRKNAALMIVNL